MMGHDNLLRLIEQLYAAPGMTAGWQTFLDSLRSAMNASAAHLIAHHPEARKSDVAADAGSDPEGLELYEQHWCAHDPWAFSAKLSPWSGALLVGEALVPHAELKRTAFYADFGRRFDVVRMIGVTLETGPASVLSVTANERRRPFGAPETALLQALIPHLRQALRLHRRLLGAEQMTEDLASVLQRSTRAVLLLDPSGHVLFMNHAAARLTAQRDGLWIDRGELRASSATATTRVRQLVAEAIHTSNGDGTGAGGLLTIERSDRRPLAALVAPLSRKRKLLSDTDAAAVLVSVVDPEATNAPDEGTLRQAFGLTPAEARLTRLLAEGLSLIDAGVRLGIRRETARSRMKAVLEKTGTHRQGELVHLILQMTPQL